MLPSPSCCQSHPNPASWMFTCQDCSPSSTKASSLRCVALQGKKARMQKQAASNLDDISDLATKTMRDGKRKLPKILSWSRTN